MKGYEEKRVFQRVKIVCETTFVPLPEIPERFSCKGYDISSGGLRISSSREPIAGNPVLVQLRLPGWPHELTLSGVISWVIPSAKRGLFESGVEFRNLSDIESQIINEFVEKNRGKR